MWVKCVLVWYSQPLTSIFGLVNSSIKKTRLECCLHPSHSMVKTINQKIKKGNSKLHCDYIIECEGWRRHSSLIFLILLFTKPNIEVSGWLYQTKTHFTHIVYQPFSRESPPSFTLYGFNSDLQCDELRQPGTASSSRESWRILTQVWHRLVQVTVSGLPWFLFLVPCIHRTTS